MTNVSTRRILWLAGLIGIVSLIVAGCGGASSGAQKQPTLSPYVQALPGDRAEMKVALPDGTLPCGLGQVNWGNQVFRMEDYPDCQPVAPNVTVYCLNDKAQWTADAVKITDTTMGAITLESQREGICGIFPKK